MKEQRQKTIIAQEEQGVDTSCLSSPCSHRCVLCGFVCACEEHEKGKKKKIEEGCSRFSSTVELVDLS